MLDRFTSPADGKRCLIDALVGHTLVAGDLAIAEALADVIELEQHPAEVELIRQGAADRHMLLVIVGSVQVRVNSRSHSLRQAGQHVGEMALIDVSAKRTASIVTHEPCVVGRVSEPSFTRLAERFPVLWRRLAIELADRVRQWTDRVPPRNERPVIFIGSASEAIREAVAIKDGIAKAQIDVRIWTDRVFRPSHGTMESLEVAIPTADFAVLRLLPHDLTWIRWSRYFAPRDNVVFELGLAMGALGRKRTIMVVPRGKNIRLPTDLAGLTLVTFDPKAGLRDRFGTICDEILRAVAELGTK